MTRSRVVCIVAIALLGSFGWGWYAGEPRDGTTYRAIVIDTLDGDTIVVRFGDGRKETVGCSASTRRKPIIRPNPSSATGTRRAAGTRA